MPEYTRTVHDKTLFRLPAKLAEFLVDRHRKIHIVADYRSAVLHNPDADIGIVADSLMYLARVLKKEARAERMRKKRLFGWRR